MFDFTIIGGGIVGISAAYHLLSSSPGAKVLVLEKEPSLGLHGEIADLIARHGVEKGRLRLELAAGEQYASLTVNEYETLLMQHDLAEVLRNPLKFAAEKARHAWNDPLAVPAKALGYAKYDLVRALNKLVDAFGLGSTRIERLLAMQGPDEQDMREASSLGRRLKRRLYLLSDRWPPLFDLVGDPNVRATLADTRRYFGNEGGATGVNQIYHDIANPNDVTLILEWESAEKAQAFINNPQTKANMDSAGVTGRPSVLAIQTKV